MTSVATNKPAMIVGPAEGKPMNILGHSALIKLGQSVTGGDYYCFEVVSPPGLGIPPHVHEHEDEVIYIAEGEYSVFLDGRFFTAGAGSTLHFPRHTAHGFQNIGTTPGKTVWTVMPGRNFEPFFDELGALPPGPPDLAKVAAIFAGYNINLLPMGEPPAEGVGGL